MENNIKRVVAVNLILSALLVVAVVLLFYFQLSPDKTVSKTDTETDYRPISAGPMGSNAVVFVNSEKLLKEYALVQKLMKQLERESKIKDDDFKSKQKTFEEEAAYFQEQVQKQTISEQSAQQIYDQLMMRQQELYELQDKYTAELAQKEFEINVTIVDSVRNYLRRINDKYNYDYILSYNEAGNILLAKDTFDITDMVIKGLNAEYAQKNEPEK
jgi:outer membrane protein